jgi:hypothetical protein
VSAAFDDENEVETLSDKTFGVPGRSALEVETPLSLDVHVAGVRVVDEAHAQLVHTQGSEGVVDDPKLLLTVSVLRADDPTDLRLTEAILDESHALGFLGPAECLAPSASVYQHSMASVGAIVNDALTSVRPIPGLVEVKVLLEDLTLRDHEAGGSLLHQ